VRPTREDHARCLLPAAADAASPSGRFSSPAASTAHAL
jgi:hypothetical protein